MAALVARPYEFVFARLAAGVEARNGGGTVGGLVETSYGYYD
jgi:hypothetical protein